MSSRAGRVPTVRSYRRRKAGLDLDLNRVPAGENPNAENPARENPIAENPAGENTNAENLTGENTNAENPAGVNMNAENPAGVNMNAENLAGENPNAENPAGENRGQEEGPSTELGPQVVEAQVNQQQAVAQPPTIDVEAIDDDVIESSPRAFAEAKNNSRRNRRRNVVDLDLEEQTRISNNNHNKRRRNSPNQTIINCDLYINLEGSSSSKTESVNKPPERPKEPVFNCPICMGPLVEEMSTRCGHIFCKSCIKAAISAQAKCPTCRKKITVKELIRVFLPSTSC